MSALTCTLCGCPMWEHAFSINDDGVIVVVHGPLDTGEEESHP